MMVCCWSEWFVSLRVPHAPYSSVDALDVLRVGRCVVDVCKHLFISINQYICIYPVYIHTHVYSFYQYMHICINTPLIIHRDLAQMCWMCYV